MISEVIHSKIPVGDVIETSVPWYIPVTSLQFINTPEGTFAAQIIEKKDGSKVERKMKVDPNDNDVKLARIITGNYHEDAIKD